MLRPTSAAAILCAVGAREEACAPWRIALLVCAPAAGVDLSHLDDVVLNGGLGISHLPLGESIKDEAHVAFEIASISVAQSGEPRLEQMVSDDSCQRNWNGHRSTRVRVPVWSRVVALFQLHCRAQPAITARSARTLR